ncbi:MAG TPA: hypothetical protein VMR06_06950 [Dokdonella sp.]|uniref:hypothetical protein n=1 Tax=Dokdonella sp. TaxID=2291710 RepID=UPI002CC3DF18|nr:hypothetical protein [Dokdonella sp.]HUD41723.1 hypothetical protein [Dokdonella sp.]
MLKNEHKGITGAARGRGAGALQRLLAIALLSLPPLAAAADAPPRVQDIVTPAAVADVVHIQPFTLQEGYVFDWRQERPRVTSGTLAVFKVAPALVYPRDAAEPVLYAGSQTAQRLNHGYESGFVVALIPGDVNLAREPVWFGAADLPEWVNADTISSERAKAQQAGIAPFDESTVRSVTHDRLQSHDLASLLRDHVAEVVIRYAPQERALADTWRLPIAQH